MQHAGVPGTRSHAALRRPSCTGPSSTSAGSRASGAGCSRKYCSPAGRVQCGNGSPGTRHTARGHAAAMAAPGALCQRPGRGADGRLRQLQATAEAPLPRAASGGPLLLGQCGHCCRPAGLSGARPARLALSLALPARSACAEPAPYRSACCAGLHTILDWLRPELLGWLQVIFSSCKGATSALVQAHVDACDNAQSECTACACICMACACASLQEEAKCVCMRMHASVLTLGRRA
jgi:hypothetical protein